MFQMAECSLLHCSLVHYAEFSKKIESIDSLIMKIPFNHYDPLEERGGVCVYNCCAPDVSGLQPLASECVIPANNDGRCM